VRIEDPGDGLVETWRAWQRRYGRRPAGRPGATTFLLSCGTRPCSTSPGRRSAGIPGRAPVGFQRWEAAPSDVGAAGRLTARRVTGRAACSPGCRGYAIFVANDQMALGSSWPTQHNRRVRKVGVIGFDDIPESAYFTPADTVRQDFDRWAAQLRLLLDQIESGARSGTGCPVPTCGQAEH